MLDRRVKAVDNLDRENIVEEFPRIIVLGGGNHAVAEDFSCLFAAADLDVLCVEGGFDFGQSFFGDVLVDKHSFDRVADRGT